MITCRARTETRRQNKASADLFDFAAALIDERLHDWQHVLRSAIFERDDFKLKRLRPKSGGRKQQNHSQREKDFPHVLI
jgi:hypothetical protein